MSFGDVYVNDGLSQELNEEENFISEQFLFVKVLFLSGLLFQRNTVVGSFGSIGNVTSNGWLWRGKLKLNASRTLRIHSTEQQHLLEIHYTSTKPFKCKPPFSELSYEAIIRRSNCAGHTSSPFQIAEEKTKHPGNTHYSRVRIPAPSFTNDS
ncbi:hypothetical protein CDAR_188261 [Caerostris darwini]|uniref:Uncharacterized protein n=1 Tax=Caerostris darwini TaxID=1538125 RepID=A0AAV4QKB8_9ARAC|nr:hypothetical protein CDAR_188261 [Caerostris darwini]